VDLKRFQPAVDDFNTAVSLYEPEYRSLGLLSNRALACEGLSDWVGLYTLHAVDPELEIAWFQPLKPKCDILVSEFASKVNSTCTATSGKPPCGITRRPFVCLETSAGCRHTCSTRAGTRW
jgi:hypothetical protein